MKKVITRTAYSIGAVLVVAGILRLVLPVSPAGFWTGSDIQCMCGLGFIHFAESEASLFIGCDEPPEGWLAPLVRRNRQTWELQLHAFKLNTNRTDYTILTNRVIMCEPGWFWMRCADVPEGDVFRLRRDFSRRNRQTIESGTPSFTTKQQADKLLMRIKERVQQPAAQVQPEGAPSD
jgi:hypothetical protein